MGTDTVMSLLREALALLGFVRMSPNVAAWVGPGDVVITELELAQQTSVAGLRELIKTKGIN